MNRVRQLTRFIRHYRYASALALLVSLAAVVYAFAPRTVDHRAFDPEEMAALETVMWRRYYEGRYLALGKHLYTVNRRQFGLSPAASTAVSWHLALAARKFRSSKGRAEAEKAIPHIERAFSIIRQGSGLEFDPAEVARLELHWWQQRREHVPTEEYATTIARQLRLIYAIDDRRFDQSSLLRAKMMAYRDERRRGKMTEADWQHIEKELITVYRLHHETVSAL